MSHAASDPTYCGWSHSGNHQCLVYTELHRVPHWWLGQGPQRRSKPEKALWLRASPECRSIRAPHKRDGEEAQLCHEVYADWTADSFLGGYQRRIVHLLQATAAPPVRAASFWLSAQQRLALSIGLSIR